MMVDVIVVFFQAPVLASKASGFWLQKASSGMAAVPIV